MVSSVRALLAGIIDYAGLFPPAQLSLDEALHNYACYRDTAESWMLGRFVCPAARLADLGSYGADLSPSGGPVVLSAVGRGGANAAGFLAGLRADRAAIAAFLTQHGPRVVVEAFETRLPPGASRSLLAEASDLIEEQGRPVLTAYYEAAPPSMESVIGALAEDSRSVASRAGFKLRCGGLEATAFPSSEQVAMCITTCRDARVALKFTAGLHNPFRHFDGALATHAHGFLNVFVAGVLAHARGLTVGTVRQIIEDQEAGQFGFDESGLHWQNQRASTEEIKAARQRAVLSFGSCSFDEPCQGLRALGLL